MVISDRLQTLSSFFHRSFLRNPSRRSTSSLPGLPPPFSHVGMHEYQTCHSHGRRNSLHLTWLPVPSSNRLRCSLSLYHIPAPTTDEQISASLVTDIWHWYADAAQRQHVDGRESLATTQSMLTARRTRMLPGTMRSRKQLQITSRITWRSGKELK